MEDVKNLKKIDIHVHATAFPDYFPTSKPGDPNTRIVSAEQLIQMYDALGIEQGVLLPLSSPEAQVSPVTSEACKYMADKYPDRLFWFCNVDPRAVADMAESNLARVIEHYKALGAKGVGEVIAHMYLDDPKVDNLFSACEKCDMPVILHLTHRMTRGYGLYDDFGLPRLEKALQKHPDLKILGHSQLFWAALSGDLKEEERGGNPKGPVTEGGRVVELLRKYPNLYCDLSAGSGANAMTRDPDFTERFIEEFSDRLMYGTDIVYTTNEHPFLFRDFLESMLDQGRISPENYRKLVRDNAIRILKL
ncbi:MAG: amidohydrolase family protein [Oscillospiraceae bacterium]|nr:amidohydrolase family protein [Oscillospiraceae bacterium]